MALLAGALFAFPVLAVDDSPDDELGVAATVAVQLGTAAGFILIPLLISAYYPGGLRAAASRLGFAAFSVSRAAKWIAIGIASYFVFAAIWVSLVGTPEQDDIASDFGPIGIQILMLVVVAPISEEICFRGMLFAGLRNRLPLWIAAILSATFFGLLHIPTGVSAVPVLIVLGAIFAVVYEKTRSIWPPIIMHALNNGLALAVLSSS